MEFKDYLQEELKALDPLFETDKEIAEIRRQLYPFRYVVLSKGGRDFIFERVGGSFLFGDAVFTEAEMAGIIRDALKQGFSVIYTNRDTLGTVSNNSKR